MRTCKIFLAIALMILAAACGGGGGGGVAPDNTAPTVETFYPDPVTDGEVASADIQANGIRVIFDEGMSVSSIDLNSFTVDVSPGFGGGTVTGSVTYDGAVRTAIFVPDTALTSSWDYVVTITTAVTDVAGNNLVADYVVTITIAAPAPPGGTP